MRDLLLDLYESRPVWWWRYALVLAIFTVVGVGLVLSWRPAGDVSVFEALVTLVVWSWPVVLGVVIVGGVPVVFRVMEEVRKEESPSVHPDDFFDIDEEFPL